MARLLLPSSLGMLLLLLLPLPPAASAACLPPARTVPVCISDTPTFSQVTSGALAGALLVGTPTPGPLLSKLQASVKDYGAVGDGSDATAAFQAAASHGAGRYYVPTGSYVISSTVLVSADNVTFFGDGPGSLLLASPSLSVGTFLWRGLNANNLLLEDLAFDGQGFNQTGAQVRTAAFVQFNNCTNVKLSRCTLSRMGYIGLSFTNSANLTVTDSDFTFIGFNGPTGEAGPAIYGSVCTSVMIYGCRFAQLYWQATFLSQVNDLTIASCQTRNTVEGSIAFALCSRVVVENNIIRNTLLNNISAHGIESDQNLKVSIVGNHVSSTCQSAIASTDCINCQVKDNLLGNANQCNGTSAHLWLVQTGANQTGVNNQIMGNVFYDDQTVQTAYVPIKHQLVGVGAALNRLFISDNNFWGPSWMYTAAMVYFISPAGTNVTLSKNVGGVQNNDRAVGRSQFPTVSGLATVTNALVTYIPRSLYLECMIVGTSVQQAHGWVNYDNSVWGDHFTAASAGRIGGIDQHLVTIVDGVNTLVYQADFVAFVYGGFSFNVTTPSGAANWCTYTLSW